MISKWLICNGEFNRMLQLLAHCVVQCYSLRKPAPHISSVGTLENPKQITSCFPRSLPELFFCCFYLVLNVVRFKVKFPCRRLSLRLFLVRHVGRRVDLVRKWCDLDFETIL